MRPDESFVGQPIRSLQTMLRTLSESDGRYTPVVPDGIYGTQTAAAVSNYQRIHGLPVTGITNQQTWEHITASYRPALIEIGPAQEIEILLNPGRIIRKNEADPHLYLVQGMLIALSEVYLSISRPAQTGILDLPTSQSLETFQALSALPTTGELDKRTWKHIALHYPLAANLKLTGNHSNDRIY